MESLKKTSDEMLLAMGLSSDMDLNIPELLLLETLVDKFDKSCTASFPVPAPAPPSCEVAVATEPSFFPPTGVEESCQTDEMRTDCSCCCSSSGAIDLRSGGSSLRLGGLGTLSLAVNGGVSVDGDSDKPELPVPSSTPVVPPPVTVAKPHHKKQLASQVSRAKAEATAAPVSLSCLLYTSDAADDC